MIRPAMTITYLVALCAMLWRCINCQDPERLFHDRSHVYHSLMENCERFEVTPDDRIHRDFISLEDIANSRPHGYIARLKFHVLAEEDAHIVFSTTQNPDFKRDAVYEFAIGISSNTRTAIRRKLNRNVLATEKTKDILSVDVPLEGVIQISSDGEIELTLSNDVQMVTKIRAKDNEPIPVHYVSFGGAESSQPQFFFNCRDDKSQLLSFDAYELQQKCIAVVDASERVYNPFNYHAITVNRDGILRAPLIVTGNAEFYVALAPTSGPLDASSTYYEFAFGEDRKVSVHRKEAGGSRRLVWINKPNIIQNGLLALFIEIRSGGQIRVYTKYFFHDSFQLLASAMDPNPIPVAFINVATLPSNHVRFYTGCTFEPHSYTDARISNYSPLPQSIFQRSLYTETEFLAKCYRSERSENNYVEYVRILKRSQPSGFHITLPLYIRSDRDALILLSAIKPPNFDTDDVIEIAIGSGNNMYSVIRSKKSKMETTGAYTANIVSRNRVLKIWIEVSVDGEVRVLMDENGQMRPLINAFHPNPINVQFMSLASHNNARTEFFFNCPGDFCHQYSTISSQFNNFYDITSNLTDSQPKGMLLKLPIYISGHADARILLSAGDIHDEYIRYGYEIVIGEDMNTQAAIYKTPNNDLLASVQETNLLTPGGLRRFVIEISIGGEIKISIEKDRQYRTLLTAYDPHPVQITHFSFASAHNENVDFFYDCLL